MLLGLHSNVCLKDKRMSCNVDEVIYSIRVIYLLKQRESFPVCCVHCQRLVQGHMSVSLSSDKTVMTCKNEGGVIFLKRSLLHTTNSYFANSPVNNDPA